MAATIKSKLITLNHRLLIYQDELSLTYKGMKDAKEEKCASVYKIYRSCSKFWLKRISDTDKEVEQLKLKRKK